MPVLASALLALTCIAEHFEVSGHSMAPLVHHNTIVEVLPATCLSPNTGDLAAFHTRANPRLVIKQIAGLPRQQAEFRPTPENPRFYILFVEQAAVLTVRGNIYKFNARDKNLISRGILNNRLRGYLFIGQRGSMDSTELGVIHAKQVVYVVTSISRAQRPSAGYSVSSIRSRD